MYRKLRDYMRILGIDPGYGTVGFGIVDKDGSDYSYVDSGSITTPAALDFPVRLEEIYEDVLHVIDKYKPDLVVIEKIFFAKNTTTAMQVAEARGVITLACQKSKLPVEEFTPLQIKMALTGDGSAKKSQVKEMVLKFLKVDKIPGPDDVLDALAVAITYT